LAAAERYQRSRTTISDALYHLVDRTRIPEYRAAAATLRLGAAPPRCTGPFPPYAFAPEILR
jgi:hypothetical protein